MDMWVTIVLVLAMGLVGLASGWALERRRQNRLKQQAEDEARRVIKETLMAMGKGERVDFAQRIGEVSTMN